MSYGYLQNSNPAPEMELLGHQLCSGNVTSMVNVISKRDFYQYHSFGSLCGLTTCLIHGTVL